MLRFLPAFMALWLLTGINAAYAADPGLLKKAAQFANICTKYMPDSKAASDAFVKAGLRSRGISGGFRIYTGDGQRIIAATTATGRKKQGCLITVDKMSVEEAQVLIKPWLKSARAAPTKRKNEWKGTFKGAAVLLGVVPNFSPLPPMRGAAIIVIQE